MSQEQEQPRCFILRNELLKYAVWEHKKKIAPIVFFSSPQFDGQKMAAEFARDKKLIGYQVVEIYPDESAELTQLCFRNYDGTMFIPGKIAGEWFVGPVKLQKKEEVVPAAPSALDDPKVEAAAAKFLNIEPPKIDS
jgi:hypothetical protein